MYIFNFLYKTHIRSSSQQTRFVKQKHSYTIDNIKKNNQRVPLLILEWFCFWVFKFLLSPTYYSVKKHTDTPTHTTYKHSLIPTLKIQTYISQFVLLQLVFMLFFLWYFFVASICFIESESEKRVYLHFSPPKYC